MKSKREACNTILSFSLALALSSLGPIWNEIIILKDEVHLLSRPRVLGSTVQSVTDNFDDSGRRSRPRLLDPDEARRL